MLTLSINGKKHELDVDLDMPLLWALRETLGLTGTKFGCGIAVCGACTVFVDSAPVRSCGTPVGAVLGREITTIEGLDGRVARAVRSAWIMHNVIQCGYCQSGQIMSAVALLRRVPMPTDEDIDFAMSDTLCRCASYQRIRSAIHEAARSLAAPA